VPETTEAKTYLQWVPLSLTVVGFVWQSAVLWQKLETNVKHVEQLQSKVEIMQDLNRENSSKLSSMDTKLTMLVDAANGKKYSQ